MSTKIYYAYICDKNYDMYSLMQKIQELRSIVRGVAVEKRAEYLAKEYVYYMDYLAIFGTKAAQEMYDKLKAEPKEKLKLSDYSMRALWKYLASDTKDKNCILETLSTYFENRAYEDSSSKLSLDSDFDYNCSIVVIPMEDKQLVMSFGNNDLKKIVSEQPWLSDYHYQNQTDAPARISDEEWEERKQTWNKAIGPDYRPDRHGFEHVLFDSTTDFVTMPIPTDLGRFTPSVDERVERLVDCMTDYPNPPEGSYGVQWVKYLRSPEFLNWRQEKRIELAEKLKNIPVLL